MTFTFDGFDPANTTPVPDVFFDVLLPHMNEAQLKVMLYIIRRTLGFKKTEDAISLKQFRFGIITKEKKQLDNGCGLKNFTTISKALKSLEQMNCVEKVPSKTDAGDDATTVYRIHFRGTARNVVPTTDNVVRDYANRSTGTAPSGVGVLRKTYPQETVIQQTDLQETVRQESIVVSAIAENDAPAATIHDLQKWKEESGKTKAVTKDMIASHSQCLSEIDDPEATKPRTEAIKPSPQTIPAGPPADAAQRTALPQGGAVQASGDHITGEGKMVEPKRPRTKVTQAALKSPEELVIDERCRALQQRINDWRGYDLKGESKGKIINEHKSIRTLVETYTDEQIEQIYLYLFNRHWRWSKPDSRYNIGAYVILSEAKGVMMELKAKPKQNGKATSKPDAYGNDYSLTALLERQQKAM